MRFKLSFQTNFHTTFPPALAALENQMRKEESKLESMDEFSEEQVEQVRQIPSRRFVKFFL